MYSEYEETLHLSNSLFFFFCVSTPTAFDPKDGENFSIKNELSVKTLCPHMRARIGNATDAPHADGNVDVEKTQHVDKSSNDPDFVESAMKMKKKKKKKTKKKGNARGQRSRRRGPRRKKKGEDEVEEV